MQLSIVVVNYNTRDLLRQCLSSVFANPPRGRQLQVIVVDNASCDGSNDMLKSEFPQVELVESRCNLGFGRANNVGFTRACGEYILLLNPDTIVLPGALDAMVDFLASHEEAGAVGCRLVDAEGNVLPSAGTAPGILVSTVRMFGLKRFIPVSRLIRLVPAQLLPKVRHFAPYDQEREVETLNGACIMTRREVIDQVGGLDEGYFMYYEESDWCLRMRRHGWRQYFTPAGEITHLVAQSAGRFKVIAFLAEYDSLLRFYRQHRSNAQLQLVRAMVVAKMAFSLVGAFLGSTLRHQRSRAAHQQELAACQDVLWLYATGRPLPILEGIRQGTGALPSGDQSPRDQPGLLAGSRYLVECVADQEPHA